MLIASHKLLTLIFFLSVGIAQAQETYFQQELEYVIDAKLDDKNHVLSGVLHLNYKNKSNVALKEIYFHYYVNAFKNQESEFAKQKLRSNQTDYYFAKDDLHGYYKRPVIISGKDTLKTSYHPDYQDILHLQLKEPLIPMASIELEIPFSYKIPFLFSRGGHVERNYQFTQWYPKPAVYDSKGWHLLPYLDNGEFFGEFGKFTVNITLPKEYVVAATGTLNTEEEKIFLDTIEQQTSRAIATQNWDRKLNIELDTVYKNIQYKAVNVHDFAWAADKKFFVVKGQVIVGTRNIDTYVYFHGKHAKEWVPAVEYVNRAIRSYSEWVGPYPYPQATAVQSLQLSNGGMEYPMFTIISPSSDTVSLDMVITHEVGHNWFYGILGSNERDHAWMDEGLNSFYENRYRSKFHPEDQEVIFNNQWLTSGQPISLTDALQTWLHNQGESVAIDTKSGDESSINYFLNAYQRPAAALNLMENYLGRENFDMVMQRYFNIWRFRHPYPSDLQKVFEQNGKHNLNWFFDDWFQRNQSTNYQITEITRSKDQSLTITLLNTEELKAPLNLSFYENGELSNNLLIPGFQGEIQQKLPDLKFDEVRLDPANYLPQKSRLSNNWKADEDGNWEQTKKLAWRFGTGLGSPYYKSVYLLPIVAYNKYDGVQGGIAMHNFDFPGRKFTYFLAPMIDFKSRTITGLAQANYTWFTNKKSNEFLEFDLTVRRFAFFSNDEFKYTLGYNRFSPKIGYNFRHSDNSEWRSSINCHPVIIIKNRVSFVFIDSVLEAQDGGDEYAMIHRLYQTFERNSVVNPISIKFELEQQKRDQSAIAKQFYIKLNTTVESKYTYARKKNISMRLFAGFFIVNDQYGANNYNDAFVQGSYSIFSRGKDDYAFDRFYMGRSEAQGLLSAQINPDIQGGFHSGVSSSFSDGQSNRYMVSINLKADLPQLPSYIPIKPFVDAAIIGVDLPNGDKQDFFWVAGVMIEVLDGFASVHIPILRSKQFEYLDSQTRGGNFLSNVSFRIAMNKLNLIKLRRQIPHTVM